MITIKCGKGTDLDLKKIWIKVNYPYIYVAFQYTSTITVYYTNIRLDADNLCIKIFLIVCEF